MDVGKRVEQYVGLRDRIKALNDAHDVKTKPFREMLEKLGNDLHKYLLDSHQDSAATENGTAYLTTTASATIADGAAFREFVIDQALWDMLDWKANKTAVEEYAKEYNALPPGVNFSRVQKIGVRRK